ncbi:polysaccharide biosynthesis tyrosine autokinase [Micropruina glycogenica]|uniref:Putative Tyrosine-protein kinase YwqD n=1 Tax=Micropruina glycogenica TaxID=75385 RepID=A0A2N9JCB3_9ACTN|nr:polysaccharide biosynthesis tyrosine autokinase [Micropruina glycogenica]SPD85138.1 putative Tyrosine-protein kinase YwqD [Micropruina glycogenica]
MTFRQVLDIVWRRRLLVAITTVLVILAAFVYARLAPVTYQATTVLRYSPAGTATLSGSSSYGSINLDLDPEYVQSPELAEAAAQAINDNAQALQAAVSVNLVEGQRINRLEVTAVGATPEQAKNRANGIAAAFIAHLKDQLDSGIADLKEQLAAQQKVQAAALKTLSKKPGDQLAQTNFSSASSEISQLRSEIATIQGNGAPVAVLQPAMNGVRQGVSFLTIMLIGLTSGLLAGAGMALIRDQFDDHVRSTEDVEEVIGDHVIGDVAVVSRRQLKLAPLPAATRLATPLNESVRALRTSLEVIFPQRRVAIVMTSAEPGEGKTFVSANLAVAMARAGRSVILVEADLRRPRVHTYFEMPDGSLGFADLVESDAATDTIQGALIETPYRGLQILPAGSSNSEPADLLAGDTLQGVLARLRGLADFVLLDSPPGLALADAAILGRVADGVLVVTALHRTRGSALRGTLQSLNANRVNVVGVVVNRSRRATVKSYGHYYHEGGAPASAQPVTADEFARAGDSPVSDLAPGSAPGEDAPAEQAATGEQTDLPDAHEVAGKPNDGPVETEQYLPTDEHLTDGSESVEKTGEVEMSTSALDRDPSADAELDSDREAPGGVNDRADLVDDEARTHTDV